MTMNFSPSELGIICFALENTYQSDSDELTLCQNIKDCVYEYFEDMPMGRDLYQNWVDEYELSDF